jgi:hypothetical protein
MRPYNLLAIPLFCRIRTSHPAIDQAQNGNQIPQINGASLLAKADEVAYEWDKGYPHRFYGRALLFSGLRPGPILSVLIWIEQI